MLPVTNLLNAKTIITDENIGKVFKAKTTTSNVKRSILGDIGNTRIVQPAKIIKSKTTKATKPRPKTSFDVDTEDKLEDKMDDKSDDKFDEKFEEKEEKIEKEISEEELHALKLVKLGIPDLDKDDADDPQACSEYAVNIMEYLSKLETKYQPSETYMESQSEVSWKMRSTLVNWLVEVHWKYKLYPETLFLAVNILDRYIASQPIQKDNLQLVGVTSLLIASKFEEIYSPSVEDFLYVCNDSYKADALLQMERSILYVLKFELGNPCPLTFLRRISKAENYDIPSRTVGKYLIEITILDEAFLKYYPSMIAAASSWLARKMLKKGEWDQCLQFYSGYSEAALESCVNEMLSFLGKNTKFKSIFKKYSSSKFLRASLFVEQKIEAWMKGEEGPTPSIS